MINAYQKPLVVKDTILQTLSTRVPIKLIQSTVGPNVIVAILLHSAQPPLIVLVNSKSKVVLSLPIQLLFDIYCINSLKLTSLAACTFVYTTWQLLSIRAFNGIRLYHPTLFQFQYVEPPTHLLPPAHPLLPTHSLPPAHPLPPTQVFPFTVQCEGYAVTKNQRCKTKIKITRAEQEHYCLKHVHQPQKRKDLSLRYNLWISPFLNNYQKTLIFEELHVKEMKKNEIKGCIYFYTFDDAPFKSTSEYVVFKVGKSTDPFRRMKEAKSLCKQKPRNRMFFPEIPIELHEDLNSLLCPSVTQVEALIHKELECLYDRLKISCVCKKNHREWFRIPRKRHEDSRLMTDQEMLSTFIRPVICNWINFALYVKSTVHSETGSS